MDRFLFEKDRIDGLILVTPFLAKDKRGYFLKCFENSIFENNDIKMKISEVNESESRKGVLRGLHFQKKFPQAKIVRVEHGEIYDVAVDLRRSSETFGKWKGVRLSRDNRNMLYIPKGFAHGFLTLSETAVVSYLFDEEYVPADEGGIMWNDKTLAINWPLDEINEVILSDRDSNHPGFYEYCSMEQIHGK